MTVCWQRSPTMQSPNVPGDVPASSLAATDALGTKGLVTFNKAMNNPAGKHAEFTCKIGSGSAQSFSAAALNAAVE